MGIDRDLQELGDWGSPQLGCYLANDGLDRPQVWLAQCVSEPGRGLPPTQPACRALLRKGPCHDDPDMVVLPAWVKVT